MPVDSESGVHMVLPCPDCGRDLQGVSEGPCPGCGEPFRAETLAPEKPGLRLERWTEAAGSMVRKAVLPLRIAFAPWRAFLRRGSLKDALTASPLRILLWFVLCYVGVYFLDIGVRYGIDVIQRVRPAFGNYFEGNWSYRFGGLDFLPLRLLLSWLQCLVVVMVGMLLAWRGLPVSKVVRLVTWLWPMTLLAGVLTILFSVFWFEFAYPSLMVSSTEWIYQLSEWGNELFLRLPDAVLGLVGGYAVGTVLQRQRWFIAVFAAMALVLPYPGYAQLQLYYHNDLYEPAREAVLGPRPSFRERMVFLEGPTFDVGIHDPILTGTWTIDYEAEGEHPPSELTFDASGSLVRWQTWNSTSSTALDLLCDGETHDLDFPSEMEALTEVAYRVLSGSSRQGSEVKLCLRLELTYVHHYMNGVEINSPIGTSYVMELTHNGTLDEGCKRLSGVSKIATARSAVMADPAEVDYPFVMIRRIGDE